MASAVWLSGIKGWMAGHCDYLPVQHLQGYEIDSSRSQELIEHNTWSQEERNFCMGAAITTNHRDIILVRHKKRHFCPVIMHTMQEEGERKVWATPLFVFFIAGR
jgi:hypothetical protein